MTSPGPVQLKVKTLGDGSGTVASAPAGINCGKECDGEFDSGTPVTLTATPASGSTFVGWAGACTGTGKCQLTLNQSMSVTARFTALPVLTVKVSGTGTVTSSPSGVNCGSDCKAPFKPGTQVTLTAHAGANSTFSTWGGACTGRGGSCVVTVNDDIEVSATFSSASPTVTVTLAGSGTGTVTSNPAGISCPPSCSAAFQSGTQVTLTPVAAAGSVFAGWTGACSGSGNCRLNLTADAAATATFNLGQGLNLLNHIIFLAQENRSLDHYFGQLRRYWKDNGYPDQSFDGLPQFNPMTGDPPLYGPPPTNPGCDPNAPPPSDCSFDPGNPVTSYHLITQCIENPSPSWNESHVDWDYSDPTGNNPATMDGFVWTAGHDSRNEGYFDVNGARVMGYYDGGNPADPNDPGDLNYYYFMASNFATSDRTFNPAMTRTHPNREYLIAATSQGDAYPVGSNDNDKALLTATTIFQELQDQGISWKIYVNPAGSNCSGPPYNPKCLLTLSFVQYFAWGQTIPTQYPNNIGTIGTSTSDFEQDVANGTLPQVVQIEPASTAGLDEHPSDSDKYPSNIQLGAAYVSRIINQLMLSQYWKDSAFILTFDEFGGLYDHVPPLPAVSPDGIQPKDLYPGDVCTESGGPTCDFTYTGYRVPLIVISPYARKNYVSHTPMDLTAILRLIEKRFGVSALTARDAAQIDMTEYFDFDHPAWVTPPTPPAQNTHGACYLDKLP